MCELTTALTIGSLVVGGLTAYQQQSYAHDVSESQNEYARRNYELQADAAKQEAAMMASQLNIQSAQINDEAADEKFSRMREAMKARARAVVAAGEAGIAGVTPDLIEKNIVAQAGQDMATIESNRQKKQQQNAYERRAAMKRGETVGLAPYVGVSKKPSLAGAMISAGIGIGGAYADYKSNQPKKVSTSSYKPHRSDGRH